jgi:hypothetical protein
MPHAVKTVTQDGANQIKNHIVNIGHPADQQELQRFNA